MPKAGKLGTTSYRDGALERLNGAYLLLRNDQFASSVYLAGRGVEAMLRAVVWKNEPDIQTGARVLETGHDLRDLLTLVRNLGLLRDGVRDDDFETRVQQVARLWFNNMRFASTKFVESWWWRIGEVRKGRTMKQAASDFYDACSTIIKRCEVLCQSRGSNKS